jgi:serine/threonine-protein kinase RsbT
VPAPADVHVAVRSDGDVVTARDAGRTIASEIGFARSDVVVVVVAVSEVARNIVSYADQGSVELASIRSGRRAGISIVARDTGPGIEDVSKALEVGHSTGRGLGLGLPACRELMDEFAITSVVGEGTTIVMRKWLD